MGRVCLSTELGGEEVLPGDRGWPVQGTVATEAGRDTLREKFGLNTRPV